MLSPLPAAAVLVEEATLVPVFLDVENVWLPELVVLLVEVDLVILEVVVPKVVVAVLEAEGPKVENCSFDVAADADATSLDN